MTDWVKDLQDLLGDVGQGIYESENTPFNELATGDWGGAATAPISAAFNFMDLPLSFVKEQVGQVGGLYNEALVRLPGGLGNPDLADEFQFGVPGAGRAVWEEGISNAPMPIQAALEVGLDPTTYLGIGPVRRAAQGLRAAAEIPGMARSAPGILGTAGVLEAGNLLYNDIPYRAISPITSRVGQGAKAGIQKVFPTAFEYTPETKLRRKMTDVSRAFDTWLSNRQGLQRHLPMPLRQTPKSLAPIEDYDVPPFFRSGFDSGVSASVVNRAYDSWMAIREQTMSHPDIPGITVPGMTQPQQGEATFFHSQRPQGGSGLLGRLRGQRDGLGIVNIPQGGWQDPNQVPYDEELLQHMANIGAAVMTDFDSSGNRMFQGIRRASEGMRRVRNAITAEGGRGIEPYIASMYDAMNEKLGGTLPDKRFLTQWGWAEGDVATTRLNALEERVARGSISQEEAYNIVRGKGFTKGSPEAVEEAAGMGAGFLIAKSPEVSVDPFSGPFAVPGISEATGRAEVPQSFSNLFEQNREEYRQYMTQLFPGLTDQEVEILRDMSIEAWYDEAMNAAGESSGMAGGATKLFQKGPGYVSKGDEGKVGVLGGEDPEAIAYHTGPEIEGLPHGKIGKPGLKQINTRKYQDATGNAPSREEYTRVTGKKAPGRSIGNDDIMEMLRAIGETPVNYNPRGGPLPNMQRVLDYWAVGKDVLVAGKPAPDWYRNAVDEVMNIVGPGRYEDAMMLIDLMAITSAGTGVRDNGRNALRAFAEWKMGSDDFIRNRLGLAPEQVDTLLNRSERWVPERQSESFAKFDKKGKPEIDPKTGEQKIGSRPANIREDSLFMSAMSRSQKKEAGNLFRKYVEARIPGATSHWVPSQGGPKTNNYAGSFVVKLWQDAIDYAMPDGPLKEKVLRDLDEAATIYTVDRHESRISNLSTAVTPMQAIVQRESRNIAARQLPDVRPEDLQAGLWYWSKNQQGFLQVDRNDDMASALREAWNEKKDPATYATIRENIRKERPDISEEELTDIADDLMRQEVVFAIVKESLGQNKQLVDEVLGDDNPLRGLWELGNDTAGIVARAGGGVLPRRRASLSIPKLVSLAEKSLDMIKRGEIEGVTLGYNGTEFVPEEATSGFAVALNSAGKSVSTGRRKTSAREINEFLARYGDLLDEPGMAERLKFGLFKMDDEGAEASFDLTLIVPDESSAINLAKVANQQAIYDIGGGRVITTGGTGDPVITEPDDIREFVNEVFGPPAKDPKISVSDAMARGVSVEEMDAVNPLSILNRRVVQPLMRQYQKQSIDRFIDRSAPGRNIAMPGDTEMVPGSFPDEAIVAFDEIGQDYGLSTQENQILNQTFDDGSRYGDRLQTYYTEGEQDIATLESSNIVWGPDATLDERLEAAKENPAVQDLIRKYHKSGIDVLYATPRDLANLRMADDLAKIEGVKFDRFSTWDLVRAAWGEQALFSPKYHLGNIQGAWLQNAFGGTFRIGTPSEFLAAFKLARGGLDEVERKEALNSLHAYSIAKKWGFDELPTYLSRGGVRAMTSSRERVSRSAMGELAGRATRSKKIGQVVGRPFAANADFSQGVETVVRGALWSDVLDREMTSAMAVLEDSIQIMARRQGLQDFEFSILKNINPVPGGPTSRKMKDHLQSLGFTSGYAERAARNFAEARNTAERVAKSELDKRQFSYDRTNLDEAVGVVAPFMYWISRAIRYYGEESLRHPQVILNYMRMSEGIESAQEDPGLSAQQKGFLRLMGTPLGFSLLMNPEAMFGVVKIFGLDSNYTPEGETQAGAVVRWLKDRGLGLYPWIDGTLNLMGTFGDTFEPDMLGIRHKTLIGSVVNYMRSQLGMDPAAAPYQTAMGQARYAVSNFVSQFTPDWMSRPVLPKAGGNTTEATMDTVIESRILANNPGISNGQLLDIMSDPDSPEYSEAFQQVATAGVAQQLLNFTLPQNYRLREDTRDVRSRTITTIHEAADKAGVTATEFSPEISDIEFATRYKQLTGKDWEPGDYAKAQYESDITRATPEAKPLVSGQSEYQSLGTNKDEIIFQKYQDIANGVDPETLGMERWQSQEIANAWADRYGHTDTINRVYELRQSYEQTHPEFAQFKAWQDQMYQLRNHLGGSLDEYRRQASAQNPNAAKYFTDLTRYVQENFPQDQWPAKIEQYTVSAEAYQAINGLPANRFDAAPVPGVPQGDYTGTNMAVQQANQYSGPPDWVTSLQNLTNQGYGMNTYGTWWNQ